MERFALRFSWISKENFHHISVCAIRSRFPFKFIGIRSKIFSKSFYDAVFLKKIDFSTQCNSKTFLNAIHELMIGTELERDRIVVFVKRIVNRKIWPTAQINVQPSVVFEFFFIQIKTKCKTIVYIRCRSKIAQKNDIINLSNCNVIFCNLCAKFLWKHSFSDIRMKHFNSQKMPFNFENALNLFSYLIFA